MADAFKHAVEIETSLRIVSNANLQKDLAKISQQVAQAVAGKELYEYLSKNAKHNIEKIIDNDGTRMVGGASEGDSKGDEKKKKEQTAKTLESISTGTQTIATSGMSVLKTSLGILTDVFERIKQASPLLQAMENLFNLAMQLFFMPLGTKLATVLIPHVTALVEDVMKIWDGFENKNLSQILEDTIHIGAEIFGKYFINIGKELSNGNGILGAVGKMITSIGNLISHHGETIIKNIIGILTFIINHIPEILGAIIAFMAVSKALQIAQIAVMMAINWKTAIAGAAALAAVAVVGSVASYQAKKMVDTAADGGYFPATPGGTQVLLAEGGEGETVVPDSKKVDFAKSVLSQQQATNSSMTITNNFVFNGYNEMQMVDKIKRTVNEQVNLSRLRSGLS